MLHDEDGDDLEGVLNKGAAQAEALAKKRGRKGCAGHAAGFDFMADDDDDEFGVLNQCGVQTEPVAEKKARKRRAGHAGGFDFMFDDDDDEHAACTG